MADERVVKHAVDCPHCKTTQIAHVARRGGAEQSGQTIQCIGCNHHFAVAFTDKIVGGPGSGTLKMQHRVMKVPTNSTAGSNLILQAFRTGPFFLRVAFSG
jgi:hypothetical protein